MMKWRHPGMGPGMESWQKEGAGGLQGPGHIGNLHGDRKK